MAGSKLPEARRAVRMARLLEVATKCARHVGQGDGLEIVDDDPVRNGGCDDNRSGSVVRAVEHGKARDRDRISVAGKEGKVGDRN